MNLRPYQSEGAALISSALARGQRPLYVCPTGGGKTETFLHITTTTSRRVLIAVHRNELVDQVSARLGDYPHGIVQSGRAPNPHARVQVASIQTLVNRLAQYSPELIIFDEAHHAVSNTWLRVLAAYPNAALMGVTATPCRTDGSGLRQAGFDTLILAPSVAELTAQGYLTPAQVYVPKGGISTEGARTRFGDFVKADIQKIVKPAIVGDAIEYYRNLADRQPAIAFCISVQHAEDTAAAFRAAGYIAQCIDGSKSTPERRQLINGLRTGAIHVLTSCDLVSEGVDIPVVACGIFLRPTQSLGLWRQQVGRVLRVSPGKTHAVCLDHVGNTLRHGLPDADIDWTLDGRPVCRAERDPDDLPARVCLQCYRTHEPRPVCPFCGFVYPARPREIQQVSGELALLDAQWAATKSVSLERVAEWQCKTLEEFQALAAERGYKPGWAFHRWSAKQRRTA